jgi:hypothetical protein
VTDTGLDTTRCTLANGGSASAAPQSLLSSCACYFQRLLFGYLTHAFVLILLLCVRDSLEKRLNRCALVLNTTKNLCNSDVAAQRQPLAAQGNRLRPVVGRRRRRLCRRPRHGDGEVRVCCRSCSCCCCCCCCCFCVRRIARCVSASVQHNFNIKRHINRCSALQQATRRRLAMRDCRRWYDESSIEFCCVVWWCLLFFCC